MSPRAAVWLTDLYLIVSGQQWRSVEVYGPFRWEGPQMAKGIKALSIESKRGGGCDNVSEPQSLQRDEVGPVEWVDKTL